MAYILNEIICHHGDEIKDNVRIELDGRKKLTKWNVNDRNLALKLFAGKIFWLPSALGVLFSPDSRTVHHRTRVPGPDISTFYSHRHPLIREHVDGRLVSLWRFPVRPETISVQRKCNGTKENCSMARKVDTP